MTEPLAYGWESYADDELWARLRQADPKGHLIDVTWLVEHRDEDPTRITIALLLGEEPK